MTRHDGSERPMTGSYREVVPGQRLVTVTDFEGARAGGDGHDVQRPLWPYQFVITQTCETAEERDSSRQGSEVLLDWCAEYLATS